MKTSNKSKEDLIQEIDKLRNVISDLKASAEADLFLHKQSMDALKESEERFELLFNQAPLGYQSLDVDGNFIEVNQQWLNTLGYEREEVIGKWFGDFLTPSFQNGFRLRFPILKAQGHIHSEFEMIHKNGSILFIAFDGRIGNDANGNFLQTHCILKDITEQKKAEEKVIQIGKYYQALIEKAPDGIALIDAEGKFKYISESAKKMFGYSPSDVIDINPDANTHPDDLPIVLSELGKIFVDPTYIPTIEYRFLNKNGQWVWIETTFNNLLGNENVEAIVLNFRDVTERKLNESIFKDIIEKNPLSIQIIDMEGYPIQENSAHTKLFGAKKNSNYSVLKDTQLLDKGFNEFFERIKKGEVVHFPDTYYDVHHVDSSFPSNPIWVSALGFTLNDINGTPEKIVLIHENITVQKIAEQELLIAKVHAEESDRLKSAFLANMSHEIRTPMNGILGFAELLKEPGLSGEEQQEYIDIIEKSGVRMLNIINDIIDISKIEAGLMTLNMKNTNINEQIEYLYTFFNPEVEAKGMEIKIRKTLPDREATIFTDSEKLYAILTNLVKNSIKYSKEGSIEIGYSLRTESKPFMMHFYIKDTGIGIPKDRQEVIFERFIQADISDKLARQGAGLGLSITRAYVEMLGGKIWVESEEGIGSTFYFTLPYDSIPEDKSKCKQLMKTQN